MNTLIDFFVMRPVFTLLGLRLLWFAFLVHQVATTATVLASREYFDWEGWYSLFTLLLYLVTNLVLIRLVIEVAAAVLLRVSPTKAKRGSN
jgi:hypothetical protein